MSVNLRSFVGLAVTSNKGEEITSGAEQQRNKGKN
jgi:hypothetical protein